MFVNKERNLFRMELVNNVQITQDSKEMRERNVAQINAYQRKKY